MEYATGDAQNRPVLLESPLKGLISNTKLHHTIMLWMQLVDTQVKAIQSDMRKRAREEITPVPAIYNNHQIHLSPHSNHDSKALQLPTFPSIKSSLYRSRSRLPPTYQVCKTMHSTDRDQQADGVDDKMLVFGLYIRYCKCDQVHVIKC